MDQLDRIDIRHQVPAPPWVLAVCIRMSEAEKRCSMVRDCGLQHCHMLEDGTCVNLARTRSRDYVLTLTKYIPCMHFNENILRRRPLCFDSCLCMKQKRAWSVEIPSIRS
jgi:hypothetical protein